jgi:hypothetical protein
MCSAPLLNSKFFKLPAIGTGTLDSLGHRLGRSESLGQGSLRLTISTCFVDSDENETCKRASDHTDTVIPVWVRSCCALWHVTAFTFVTGTPKVTGTETGSPSRMVLTTTPIIQRDAQNGNATFYNCMSIHDHLLQFTHAI